MRAAPARAAARTSLLAVVAASCCVAAAACSSPAPRVTSPSDAHKGGGDLDPEAARRAVAELAIAVVNHNAEQLRRVLSLPALAAPFRPKKVAVVSPALQQRFNDEAVAQLLDPRGAFYKLVAGLEVGGTYREGGHVVVEAKSPRSDGGLLRFRVSAYDGGPPRIVRIE